MNSSDLNYEIKESFLEYFATFNFGAMKDEDLEEFLLRLNDDDERSKILYEAFRGLLQSRGLDGPGTSEVILLRTALSSESDRGCALMATSYLDSQLEKMLQIYMVDDKSVVEDIFRHTGALGTFSSKIDLAYALGLLSRSDRRSIHLLRKIRNRFAHVHLNIDFNTDGIRDQCNELTRNGLPEGWKPRHKFIRTVIGIAASIHFQQRRIAPIQPLPDIVEDDVRKAFRQDVRLFEDIGSEISGTNLVFRHLFEHLKASMEGNDG